MRMISTTGMASNAPGMPSNNPPTRTEMKARARDGGVRFGRCILGFRPAICPRIYLRLLLRVFPRAHTQLLPFAMSYPRDLHCRRLATCNARPRLVRTALHESAVEPYGPDHGTNEGQHPEIPHQVLVHQHRGG